MGNLADAAAVRAGLSNALRGAFMLPADRGRTAARVRATCLGLSSVEGTSVPGASPTAHTHQQSVFGQASTVKPCIYTTRVDAVGVKGSHPAREPV